MNINDLIDRALRDHHPVYPDVYNVAERPGELPRSVTQSITEAGCRSPHRKGRPCRLVKSQHRIAMSGGHDIQPGQLCVVVETAGKGSGREFDGIHAVRARLPTEKQRHMRIARVQYVPGGGYRLGWASRASTFVPEDEISFVGNVVGCYSADELNAPLLTLFSN